MEYSCAGHRSKRCSLKSFTRCLLLLSITEQMMNHAHLISIATFLNRVLYDVEELMRGLKLMDHGRDISEKSPLFCSRPRTALTRSGIYKIVRKHGCHFDTKGAHPRRVTPHLFRHTAAVHLLESGVDVNVIRGWLGHVGLETTNRYAELTLRAKEAALRECEAGLSVSVGCPRKAIWKDDESLLQMAQLIVKIMFRSQRAPP